MFSETQGHRRIGIRPIIEYNLRQTTDTDSPREDVTLVLLADGTAVVKTVK